MITKTDKHQYFFEVEVKRTEGRRGMLSAKDVHGAIEIATAPEFEGGVPGTWTPEHLFLGSVCSGFLTAYVGMAANRNLEISHLTCAAIGQINLYENSLEFTTINLYPKIYIDDETQVDTANELLLFSYKHCIVANSIKPLLINHGEVLVEKAVV